MHRLSHTDNYTHIQIFSPMLRFSSKVFLFVSLAVFYMFTLLHAKRFFFFPVLLPQMQRGTGWLQAGE